MVRYANRSRTAVSVFKGSTPCVTHYFSTDSLHALYELGSPCRFCDNKLRFRATNMSQWPGWAGSPGRLLCGKRLVALGVDNRPLDGNRQQGGL